MTPGRIGRRTSIKAVLPRPRPPNLPTKTKGLSCSTGNPRSNSRTGEESGTRNSLPVFVRSAGTVQQASSKLISHHRAPKASPVRQATRIVNCSAFAAMPACWRSSVMKAGASANGKAAKCCTFLMSLGDGNKTDSAPSRSPGCRSCEARHDGPGDHGLNPSAHLARGLGFRVPERLDHAKNVVSINRGHVHIADLGKGVPLKRFEELVFGAPILSVLLSRFASIGSIWSASWTRARWARLRASAKLKSRSGPRPSMRSRPPRCSARSKSASLPR